MKLTLLEMTQSILSSMGSDEVNSISDTTESLQVADIIRQTYMNMIGRYDLPQHNQLFQLQPSNDATRPTLMTFPNGVVRIEWMKYLDTNPADSLQVSQFGAYSVHDTNTDLQSTAFFTTSVSSVAIQPTGTVSFTVASTANMAPGLAIYAVPNGTVGTYMIGTIISVLGSVVNMTVATSGGAGTYTAWTISNEGVIPGPVYKEVKILPVEDFIVMNNSLGPNVSNDIGSFNFATTQNATGMPMNFQFYYRTDKQPEYCCIIGNEYVIFDSYDNSQDSTLQAEKVMSFGWVYPPFLMVDNAYPPIEDQLVPLLLNDAKSLSFFELKRTPHQKAEEEVNRQVVSLQKYKAIANKPTYFEALPNFGRRWSGKYWSTYA